jgi:hypothetical protein
MFLGAQACAVGHFGMPTEALPLAPGEGVEGSFAATGGVGIQSDVDAGVTPLVDATGFLRVPITPRDSFIASVGGGYPQVHVALGVLHTFAPTTGPQPWHGWFAWTLGANTTLFYGGGGSTTLAFGGTRDLSTAHGWTVEGSMEVGYGAYGTGGVATASYLFGTGPTWRLRASGPRQPFVMLRAGATFGHSWFSVDQSGERYGPRWIGVGPGLQVVVGARPK